MRKIIIMFLSLVVFISTMMSVVGCGGGIKIDTSKTQLYISNNNQGVGTKYIEEIGREFEKDFADYSFEEGKKGVQVLYNHNTRIAGEEFYVTMEKDLDYIYFTEYVDYGMNKMKFKDVTDVMRNGAITGVDESGNFIREEDSIESKVDLNYLDFLNNGTDEKKEYRAVPFYLALKNLNYDMDLWSKNKFYFAKGACPSDIVAGVLNKENYTQEELSAAVQRYEQEIKKVASGKNSDYWSDQFTFVDGNGNNDFYPEPVGLSAGPDGRYETADDGLPATYDEFYALLDRMSRTVVPIIWTGANPGYADNLTSSLFQDYMGVEDVKIYYHMNSGEMDELVKFDASGNILKNSDGSIQTESVMIDDVKEKGYEVQRHIGKYYALQFANKIANKAGQWTHDACYGKTVSQLGAQTLYLTEGHTTTGGEKQIAMIIDGTWWQQEANSTFEVIEKKDPSLAKDNRNFGMLYLPNANIEKLIEKNINGEKNVIVAANDSLVFINDNLREDSPALKVSKVFLSYFNNEKCINIFTKNTNMLRAMNVEYSESAKQDMSPYGRNLINYGENVDIIYPYGSNEVVNSNKIIFENTHDAWNWHMETTLTKEQYYPITTFHDYREEGLTPEIYFYGMYHYYKDIVWENKLK